MITINSISEHYDTNVQILLHPDCLPVALRINGKVHTIAKSNGKYVLNIEDCPLTFPFNRLENLLYSEFTNEWE